MSTFPRSILQKVVTDLLYHNGLAEAFRTAEDFHLRVENEPWLPLVIERHCDQVSITHYVERGDDLTRDPEMVFALAAGGERPDARGGWPPLSLEPGGFGRVHVVAQVTPERQLVWYPGPMKEALGFAAKWGRNLRAQGFVRRYPAGRISSLSHPDLLTQVLAAPEVPVRITHRVTSCTNGSELHAYTFPDDLPRALRPAGYRQAEAALKGAWPDWAVYGFGLSGQGVELHTRPLPACTCG